MDSPELGLGGQVNLQGDLNIMPDKSFWNSKTVFITGHTGFKGSWLSYWLRLLGANVYGYALNPETEPNLFHAAGLADDMDSRIGDIRDEDKLHAELKQVNPDIVLHLAAQALVRRSYEDPVATFDTNVMGTVRLLNVLRELPHVGAVVVITSDKCYENQEWSWPYRETDEMGGHDPYSSSKACVELLVSAFRRSFYNTPSGIPLATARAGNVIGGGDWSVDRLVPDLIRGFDAQQPVVIRNPTAIRPWQHVLEPLSGYLLLAQKLYEDKHSFSEAWNFGPHEQNRCTVAWIADQLVGRLGAGAGWKQDHNAHPHEAHVLSLDNSKALHRLGWRPRWNIHTTLDSVVRWYQAHAEQSTTSRLRDEMQLDIERYSQQGL